MSQWATHRDEDIGCGILLCKLETLLLDIYSDDTCGSECLGHSHAEETDWACTKDDDIVSTAHLGEVVQRMYGHREGFNHGSVLERHLVRDLVQHVVWELVYNQPNQCGYSQYRHNVP